VYSCTFDVQFILGVLTAHSPILISSVQLNFSHGAL
jgi:hypothetical protein